MKGLIIMGAGRPKGSGNSKVTKPIEDRIAENDALIESLKAQLSEAKSKRKELLQIKKSEEYEAIQKIIKESGMTPDQLKELIESKK